MGVFLNVLEFENVKVSLNVLLPVLWCVIFNGACLILAVAGNVPEKFVS